MKPLFAINLTEDKNNTRMNAEAFLAHELTASEIGGFTELKSMEQNTNEEVTENEAKILTRREEKRKIREERKKRREEKKRLREETAQRVYDKQFQNEKKDNKTSDLQDALSSAYSDVGVPKDADDVDIFSFSYVIEEGVIIPVIPDDGYTYYVNLPMKMYVKSRKLYLSDLTRAYAFDLDSMRSITKVKSKIAFPFWHKEAYPKDPLYKPYGIKRKRLRRTYVSKYYYVLTLEADGEQYEIMFAPYDLSAFERLAEVSLANCKKK